MIKRVLSSMIVICFLMTSSMPVFATTGSKDETTGDVVVENTYIRTTTNKENGRFSIKTVDGSPYRENDSHKKLLFMELTPETSFTTFRIDGQDYIFGNHYSDINGLSSEWIEKPQYYGKTSYCKWRIGDIYIKQYLIVENDFVNEGDVRIKYVVENKGDSKEISCRILLDTMVGDNDGSSIMLPGHQQPITNETEYSGEDVPSFWYSPENEDLKVIGKGSLLTGRFKGIDRFVVGHWQNLSKVKYDYTVDETLDFSNTSNEYAQADSAVCLYFENVIIPKGVEEVFTTTYGIGSITELKEDILGNETAFTMGFSTSTEKIDVVSEVLGTETKLKYAPEYIELIAYIDNTYEDSELLSHVTFDISKMLKSFGNIFELSDDEKSIKTIEAVKKGEVAQVTFKLNIKEQSMGNEYEPYVDILVDGKIINTPKAKIFIPKLTDMQNTAFLDVSPKNIFTGAEDKRLTLIGTGFKYISNVSQLTIKLVDTNGAEIAIQSDLIAINGDSNIFVTIPDEVMEGEYDIFIYNGTEEGQPKLVQTFEKTLVLTSDEKFAIRVYPELVLNDFPDITAAIPDGITPDEWTPYDDKDIEPTYKANAEFKIKGILQENDGVYKTIPGTIYLVNDYIKFEGQMVIDPSKPFKNTINDPEYDASRIRGSGKFYVDIDKSDGGFSSVTFYEGKFRIGYFDRTYEVSGEEHVQKNGYFGLEPLEAYGTNLFENTPLPEFPVGIKSAYFINEKKVTDDEVVVDKYVHIDGNWYFDVLKEMGIDISLLVSDEDMMEMESVILELANITNIRGVRLNSSGVDYNGYVRFATPLVLGPKTAFGLKADINTYEDIYEFTVMTPMPHKSKKNQKNPTSGLSPQTKIKPKDMKADMKKHLEGGKKSSKNQGGIKSKVKSKFVYDTEPEDDQLKFTLGFADRALNEVEISADTEIKLSPLPLEISNISGAVENIQVTDVNPTLLWLSVDIRDTLTAETGGFSAFLIDGARITVSDKFMSVTGDVKSFNLPMGESHTAIVWDHNGVEKYNFNGFFSDQEFRLPIYPPAIYWENKGRLEIVVGDKLFVDEQRMQALKDKAKEMFVEDTKMIYTEETKDAYNGALLSYTNQHFDAIRTACINEEISNFYGENPTNQQLKEYEEGPQFPTSILATQESGSTDLTFYGNFEGNLMVPHDIMGVHIPYIGGKRVKLFNTGFKNNRTFFNYFNIPLKYKGVGVDIGISSRFNMEDMANGEFPFGMYAKGKASFGWLGSVTLISLDEGAGE